MKNDIPQNFLLFCHTTHKESRFTFGIADPKASLYPLKIGVVLLTCFASKAEIPEMFSYLVSRTNLSIPLSKDSELGGNRPQGNFKEKGFFVEAKYLLLDKSSLALPPPRNFPH